VLVTTIDDYAGERGIFPAIIDGVADRLRPVFLTTATTVLGLAPLLYETSQQAQFLRPTVVTLTYGLGFGLVLVLLVVPSLLAIGHDLSRNTHALRRGLAAGRRVPGFSLLLALGIAGLAGLFATTMGTVMATGAMPAILGGSTSMLMALGLFAAGAAAWTLVLWLVASLRYGVASKA